MAQPPLSQQLKALEQGLGVELFERLGKKLELTLAGKSLYKRAVFLLDEFDETINVIQDIKSGVRGEISIGVTAFYSYMLPEKINNFRKQYPEVTFRILQGDANRLVRLLEEGKVELAIVNLPVAIDPSIVEVTRLGDIKFSLFVPTSWGIEESKHSITYKEIEPLPLILSRREEGNGGTYDAIIEEGKRHDVKLNIICECNDIHPVFTLVEAGVGATIMPDYVLDHFYNNNIQSINIVDSSLNSKSAILRAKKRYMSKIAEQFLHTLLKN